MASQVTTSKNTVNQLALSIEPPFRNELVVVELGPHGAVKPDFYYVSTRDFDTTLGPPPLSPPYDAIEARVILPAPGSDGMARGPVVVRQYRILSRDVLEHVAKSLILARKAVKGRALRGVMAAMLEKRFVLVKACAQAMGIDTDLDGRELEHKQIVLPVMILRGCGDRAAWLAKARAGKLPATVGGL